MLLLAIASCAQGENGYHVLSGQDEYTHVYTGITPMTVKVDPARWRSSIIKVCEREGADHGFCAYGVEVAAAAASASPDTREVAFFSAHGEPAPDGFGLAVNAVEPTTIAKLKDDWTDIQVTCTLIVGTACGIVGLVAPGPGIVCGFGAGALCSRSPETFGIEGCTFFEPQPGQDRSFKLTPASAGAIESTACNAAAGHTVSQAGLNQALTDCMLSIPNAVSQDACTLFPSRCFYVQEVQHPVGTEVPSACRKIIR
jgi:hypothetical protein